ncbi:MAG TPA: TetR/AcrR family transcriptional regulator [Gammaproteobacteria bacterium]|nr:TetR/AcrR family transcriptional regulator [Gammaproteobacteria bacterium]
MNTRDRIVEAAERIMRTQGIAQATTKEIAREACCSEGTLYNHFESKEALFLAVLRDRLPDFIRQVVAFPERAGSGTVRGNLEEIGCAALSFYREVIPLGACLLSEPGRLATQRDYLRERGAGPHKAHELVARYLRAEQEHGRVRRNADPLAAARLLLGGCFQQAYISPLAGLDISGTAGQHLVENLVDTLMAALSPE